MVRLKYGIQLRVERVGRVDFALRHLTRGDVALANEFSETKGADVYIAKEIRIFDEIEKGKNTTVIVQEVDLRELSDSIFTKAWLESKSR